MADGAGGDLSGEAAEVLVGADDALDGETEGLVGLFDSDGDGLECRAGRGRRTRGCGAGLDYVIAGERADGNEVSEVAEFAEAGRRKREVVRGWR